MTKIIELRRDKGRFTKRLNSAECAHPLIRRFVELCAINRTLRVEVEARSGINDSVIGLWENGTKHPRLSDFQVLVQTIGYRLAIVINGIEQEIPEPDGIRHPMILWLLRRRATLGLSHVALAGAMGEKRVHPTTISGWEGGKHAPKLKDYDAAVRAMGACILIREELT